MLKKDDEAKLIARYRIGEHDKSERTDFYQPLGADAQYVAILAREFPDRLKKISAQDFQASWGRSARATSTRSPRPMPSGR